MAKTFGKRSLKVLFFDSGLSFSFRDEARLETSREFSESPVRLTPGSGHEPTMYRRKIASISSLSSKYRAKSLIKILMN